MKLVVGLGNPGAKYLMTRHNAGFMVIDVLTDRWRARGPRKQYESECFEAEFGGERVLILKPQTFMNLSGRAVAEAYRFHKCSPDDLVVVHDEIDLHPMQLRIKTGGGTGGHNGLKSIDESLGAGQRNYHRVRVGVGKPSKLHPGPSTRDHVLNEYSKDELRELPAALHDAADAVELILRGQVRDAMNKFNGSKGMSPESED